MKKTVAFSKNAVNVFFHILTRCNLKCRHCYINPKQHGTRALSIDTINRWLAAFSPDRRRTNVIFLGGEPTLHPELPLAVRTARKLGYASVTIDTNGYLFHDILSKVTPDEVDYFSFSLDGATPETNDAIRGKGSHERCLQGIRNARAAGFNISLIYTISRANIRELADMPPLLGDLGIQRFFIQVLGLRGQSAEGDTADETAATRRVSRNRWLDTILPVSHAAARLGITVTYPKVYLDPGEPFECAGLVADNYFIFPNGRVYRCPLCEDFPMHGLVFEADRLVKTGPVNETDLFHLTIPEGCVMNRLIQPGNLDYDTHGKPRHRIACCMLKEEVNP